MSSFHAHSRVCSGINYKNVVGVKPEMGDDDLLVATVSENMVLLYKVIHIILY